jgi:hypothetical protein
MVRKHNGIRLYSWSTCAYCAVSGRKCRYIKTKQFLFTIFKTMDTIKRCDLRHVLLLFQHKALFACAYHSLPGADPVVLLTDALNLALVGGSVGILPREILKSRTSEMRFPAFWGSFSLKFTHQNRNVICWIFGGKM